MLLRQTRLDGGGGRPACKGAHTPFLPQKSTSPADRREIGPAYGDRRTPTVSAFIAAWKSVFTKRRATHAMALQKFGVIILSGHLDVGCSAGHRASYYDRMPIMTLRLTNSAYESVSSESNFATIEEAYAAAVRAGIAVAVEEVKSGLSASIVEVAVDLVGQRYAARGSVALATSRLLPPTA